MPYILTYADTADENTVSFSNKSNLNFNGFEYPAFFKKTECTETELQKYRKVKEQYYFTRCSTFIMDYNQHYQEVKAEYNIVERIEIDDSWICVSNGEVVGFLLNHKCGIRYYPLGTCGKYLDYSDTICLRKKAVSNC